MNFRYAYANAFSRFSEAIQDYLANIDNTPDPSITKEHFVEELDKAHETLFNSWLSGKGRMSFHNIPFCTFSFSVTKLRKVSSRFEFQVGHPNLRSTLDKVHIF